MTNLTELYDAIVAGQLEKAVAVTQQAINEGAEPQSVITDNMIPGMEEIGKRFEEGKAFVPNLLMSARAMKGALELLKPLLKENSAASRGKVLIGTVKGDLHDIGKNLVSSMLEGCGFEVVNLGIDVSGEKFVEAVRNEKPDLLCLSALLTTTMEQMKLVLEALSAAGLRGKVKVMVGGAPLSENYARNIGADGYSSNANGAVMLARQLIGR